MKYTFDKNTYEIKRYPITEDKSLRAWNAGDELLLLEGNREELEGKNITIYNDRFGFLTTFLMDYKPLSIIDYKSQEKSILMNLMQNNLVFDKGLLRTPLDKLDKNKTDIAFVKMPKSLDHFTLYLEQIIPSLNPQGQVICSFMTRHFTPQILKIAELYFEEITQSKAVKKARTITLRKPKKIKPKNLTLSISVSENNSLNQYLGIFSAKKVDVATQFLLDNMIIDSPMTKVLDLGSGNGVLAKAIEKETDCDLHLIDDSWLAVESSKLNFTNPKVVFHWLDELSSFEDNYFDFIISNPPFHFGHENNIDVTINLFRGIKRALSKNGEFQMVANKHLNYATHLGRLFSIVEEIDSNDKFVIYSCRP